MKMFKILGSSAVNPQKGIPDIPVPQAIDEGVQHGGDYDVHYRGHCTNPGGMRDS
jgi:hypothetical protein